MDTREVTKLAADLLGSPVAIALCRGGRNSRVYRVETSAGTFALKLYPDDGRNRARREYNATALLARAGLGIVPRPIAICQAERAAVYSWLEGQPVWDVTLGDIDSLADFAAELHSLDGQSGTSVMPDAVEACFNEQSVLDQIQQRLERFTYVQEQPMLQEFFAKFAPVLDAERNRVRSSNRADRRNTNRTLSPSDFGFHNALRMSASALAFLDFEYFGWDEPVKLVADVCWHPGMSLSWEMQEHFINRCVDIYRDDPRFEERFRGSFGLFGLRWCLIVLNEFLPAFWSRRVAAGMVLPASTVLPNQLEKANLLLERVIAGLP